MTQHEPRVSQSVVEAWRRAATAAYTQLATSEKLRQHWQARAVAAEQERDAAREARRVAESRLAELDRVAS